MNEYKKKIDEIHAPESLITATLNRIHEEEKVQETTKIIKKPHRWIGISSMATVAAAIVLAIGLSGSNSRVNLIYNTVPETIVRTMSTEQTQDSMDVEEYSDYLGLDIQNLMENAALIKSEIHVVYEGEGIKEDEGCAYYNVGGEQVMIRFSKTMVVVPENLVGGEMSEVNGQAILAGVSRNGKEHMAAFEGNGINCFLSSSTMEQQEFEAFLLNFLKIF